MEMCRPDSEQILKKLQYEEAQEQKKSRGKLKIFLGYAAGSGKTYAMLQAAHEAKQNGIDVAAGYIEPHDRKDTQRLTEGLEQIPVLETAYKGVTLREFDLDGALRRRPGLILVDELAHTNAPGCRNEKRYQDVRELLRAGIDVYTTMNIQHLESLNDIVENITHIQVRERVPDKIFDHADQVEVIDLEPEELIQRMKEGKIYRAAQAEQALQHFFQKEKLVALREMALRRTADRVKRIAQEEREALGKTDYHTGEHILTCISAASSSAKVIRSASRLAAAFHAQFTALYVETAAMQEADVQTKEALKKNLELARVLGAKIVTLSGSDIGYQIAEYAMVSNVSKVVMGRTNHSFFSRRYRPDILGKLNSMAPHVDVYIIPDMGQTKVYRRGRGEWKKTGKTMVCTGAEAGLVFVLAAIATFARGTALTFLLLSLTGMFGLAMMKKLRQQNKESAKKAYRTELLLENSRKLRRCRSRQEVWNLAAEQAGKLLSLSLVIYPVQKGGLLEEPLLFPRKGMEQRALEELLAPQERAVAQWVVTNHHRAGACTHTLPTARGMYLPIQDAEDMKGVMGILLEERREIQEFKYNVLTAMLNETGVKLQDTFLLS